MKKAQTSTEFTILIAVMMVVFIVFFSIISQKMSTIQQQEKRDNVKEFSNLVTNEVSLAKQVRNNYQRQFTLPETIDGDNYNISLMVSDPVNFARGAELIIYYDDESYVTFLDGRINGTVTKGVNLLKKENNIIQIN
jgi:hypothetical protein